MHESWADSKQPKSLLSNERAKEVITFAVPKAQILLTSRLVLALNNKVF